MALISFFGFFFLVIFGGIGLSALPIEMIRSFVNRPKVVRKWKKIIPLLTFIIILNIKCKQKTLDAANKRQMLKDKVKNLIKLGEKL
jgi:hypothetical protein